jgi:outer membrane protein assembly factor BamB
MSGAEPKHTNRHLRHRQLHLAMGRAWLAEGNHTMLHLAKKIRHRSERSDSPRPAGGRAAAKPARSLSAGMLLAATIVSTTAVAALTAQSASAVSYQDWPTFLQNNGRTSATVDPKLSVANASTLKLKWTYATGGPVVSSPSIVGTTAYFGSWDGYEYAVSTTNGALLWKTFLGQTTDPACDGGVTLGVTSAPTISNGVLYVGGGGPYWYALNATTGAVLWSVYTGDNSQSGAHYNWSSPLIVNGFAYIGIASNCDNPLVQGQLLQVNLASHQIVNTYDFVPNGEVGGGIWTTPTYDPATNTIFVSTGTLNDYTQTQSQAIVALNATTLTYESSWQLPFAAAVSDSDWGTTPTLTTDTKGDQLLSLANKNGVLYTFNRNDLAAGPIWQDQVAIGGDCPTCGDGSIASGVFANAVLYYAGGHNEQNGAGSNGSISAINPGTGSVIWIRHTEGPIIGAPAYVNGMIAYSEGTTFEVLNAATGALLYSYRLGGFSPSDGAVSVARSQFYVGANDGKLYTFGLNSSTSTPPADPNCPSGFTCQDIRNPGVPGSESTTNGVLTVTASGAAIHGTSDQFRFISEPVTGDSQSSVEILSQSTQNAQPQAGLMVRQSADPSAPYFAVLAYPNDLTEKLPLPAVEIWYRTCFGCTALELTKWYPATLPLSVMIQRQGNIFNAGISFDNVNYQLIPGASADIDMPATTLDGIAVDSGATTNTGSASFTDISGIGVPIRTVMAPQAPANPCPATWTCTDVGNPNPPGDTTVSGTSYTLDGTGTGIGGGPSDSFHYVYQSVSGNESISAQVLTQSGSPPTSQAGLMMREDTSATSPFYALTLEPGGSATIWWRTYYDVTQRFTLPETGITSPAYVEIVSYTDTTQSPPVTYFSALTSPDGVNWSPLLGSTEAISMGGGPYLAGMAATAAAARVTPPAVFNNPTIAAVTSAPPGVCAAGFSCSDIGDNILPGNQTALTPDNSANTTWTIQAGGTDIWSTYDNFRFVSEPFPSDTANSANGDGTISARVLSQTNVGGPWMKSGVMIRSGTNDPQAPYYGVFVTPSNGIAVQWRSGEAAQTGQVLTSAPALPVWLLASRYTDTSHNVVYYSAYMSTDGSTWTYIAGSEVTLSLPGPLVAGLATDSYNASIRSTATIDNVAELPGSSPPPYLCPAGWTCSDIGGPLPSGQDQLTSSGTWNEVGGGGDIWDPADAFHFVYQNLSGDGTVTAHVTAQQDTSPWAKAGPMLRASTDPASAYYAAFVTAGDGIAVQWRATDGGTTNQLLVSGTVPVYLMIGQYTTTGSDSQTYFTAYTSPDGVNWTAIPGSTQPLTLPEPLLAGFAITSHDQGVGSAVTLNSVAVTPGEVPPPGLACPSAWNCGDIGGATPIGGQTVSSGTWSVQGGGGDIWGASDSFHYVWQTLSGGGSVSAQVLSQTPTDPWSKAGVMVRASTDPGSAYYAAYLTPGNGIVVQTRTAQGTSSVQLEQMSGVAPAYLEVTWSGSTFSASTSSDGVNWSPVPGSAVSIPAISGTALAGLAVTSHNTTSLSTVQFNAVTIG